MSNVPRLRFKEFSYDFDNEVLADLLQITSKKFDPTKNQEVKKCIELEHLSQETGCLLGYTDSNEQDSIKNSFEIGQVLFGKLRPYLKKYWQADFGGVCSSEIWVLNGIQLVNSYLYHLVQTSKFNQIANVSSGSKMPRSDWQYMSQVPFNYPSKQEQEKIAAFLSAVDNKIELLGKKQELLKEYKKGLMQKIFTQEIRFEADDGSEFPDWEEKKLSTQTTIQKGSQLNKDTLTEEGNYPALNGGINPSGFTTDWNTEANTITISEGGNSCGYVNFVRTRFWSGGHNYSLQDLKKTIQVKYLYQYLKFNELQIMRLRVGSGLPNIQKGEISNFKVSVPCLEEQTKIANFLSSIDNKIEQVGEQLDKSKEFKKALLQQMFV